MVARTANPHGRAFLQLIVHELRSAPTVRVEQHADLPLGAVGGVAAQRILAHQRRCHEQIDVCTRRPLRQVRAVRVGKRQSDDTVGDRNTTPNFDVNLDFTVGGPGPGRLFVR